MNTTGSQWGGRRIFVVGLVLASVVIAAMLFYLRLREPAPPDPLRFAQKISSFAEMDRETPPPSDPIVFVGSSSIRLWPTDSLFSDLPVVNRGFGGSHISDVNYYVRDVVLPYRPSAIVFYAGDNDVNDGKSPERVLRDYQEFVTHVRSSGQTPRILFLAIKPSPSRWTAWPRMAEANDLIRQFSNGDTLLEYVDVASPMLGAGGRPSGDLFVSDSLHLSDEGYRLWTGILRPRIDQGRGD
ncbi:MAG: GDSL-type esterase/lipase family protein [Rhodothermales bacterium]|nr:GDSL-type esterase/lipase family protein [Rhodothermales bacterium]